MKGICVCGHGKATHSGPSGECSHDDYSWENGWLPCLCTQFNDAEQYPYNRVRIVDQG